MEQASTVVQLESSVRFEWRSVPCGTDYTFHTSRTLFTRAFTVSLSFSLPHSAFRRVVSALRRPASCVCSVWSAGRCTRADCLRVVRGVERLRPLTGLVVCLPARAARRPRHPNAGAPRSVTQSSDRVARHRTAGRSREPPSPRRSLAPTRCTSAPPSRTRHHTPQPRDSGDTAA